MTKFVSIKRLSEGAVFAALYNAAQPPRLMGVHFLSDSLLIMEEGYGQQVVDAAHESREYTISRYDVDYCAGRPMKLVFTDDGLIKVTDYEADNGQGVAEAAISHLRSTGQTLIEPTCSPRAWLEQITEEALRRYDDGDFKGCYAYYYIKLAHHPDTRLIVDMKPALGMIISSLEEGRSEARRAMLAWTI